MDRSTWPVPTVEPPNSGQLNAMLNGVTTTVEHDGSECTCECDDDYSPCSARGSCPGTECECECESCQGEGCSGHDCNCDQCELDQCPGCDVTHCPGCEGNHPTDEVGLLVTTDGCPATDAGATCTHGHVTWLRWYGMA